MAPKNGCILLLLGISISCFAAMAQEVPCRQMTMLVNMLEKYHYKPVELNQTTSAEIFDDFIERLDPYGNIFISGDIKALEPYKNNLFIMHSDEKACSFLKSITELYLRKLQKTDTLVSSILEHPFDFDVNDSIVFTGHSQANFAANDGELKKRWVRRLKYKALNILCTPAEEADPIALDNKQLLLKEAGARKKLMSQWRRFLQRMTEHPSGYEMFMAEQFFNTIANRYDPHTLYLSAAGKERFLLPISKEARAFGLSCTEGKNGEVEIGYLTPGGPAWKSNQLHRGDVLLQLKWPEGEALDLSYSSDSEVDEIINNSGYDKMWLTVKKANGMVSTVALVRETIDVEENIIAGYILKGEKRVGYISLPGFYTSRDDQVGLGCANDVAKEIFKLQKENIEGLILDLRYNGGGSLHEAIGLAGIFIDQGPLCMAKDRYQNVRLMKDLNRGTVFNGPLVVMVNGFSASASELVAAGLRDYNRALIVGSNTFGKAIAQVTFPLDSDLTSLHNLLNQKNRAFVNITVEQLYRVNGISHQKTGIAPDIELPELFTNLDDGETSEPYAILPDRVDKKVYYTPLPALPVTLLAEKSRSRTEQHDVFTKIKQLSDSLRTARKQKEILVLKPAAFSTYVKKDRELKAFTARLMKAPAANYSVLATRFDEAVIKSNNFRKEMNAVLMKKLTDDIYIEEAYSILTDLIDTQKK